MIRITGTLDSSPLTSSLAEDSLLENLELSLL